MNNGTVHIVMGGQFGSEGKGEFAAFFAKYEGITTVVRTGGPNAGHTVTDGGQTFKMQQIPTSWIYGKGMDLYIGPGSLIDLHQLKKEADLVENELNHPGELPRLFIDQNAVVINDVHRIWEEQMGLRERLGSTAHGIGAARAEHIKREVTLMKDIELFNMPDWISVHDTGPMLQSRLERGIRTFSLRAPKDLASPSSTAVTTPSSPPVTSPPVKSSTTPESPAVRTTGSPPSAGPVPSGSPETAVPLEGEISWEELQEVIPHLNKPEITTVTRKPRRIAREPDWDELERMKGFCQPDSIALTFLDYAFPGLYMCTDAEEIWNQAESLIWEWQSKGFTVDWVSTGPGAITRI